MNRRGFFRGLVAAALTAAAQSYVPAALAKTAVPGYVVDDWRYWVPRIESIDLSKCTVRFTLRDGTPSPTVQAWLDECGSIVTKHVRAEA